MVVIGIAVLLMALMIPTGRALREGNRMMTCKAQLQQIGQAIKTYHLDEGGVPPYYVDTDEEATDPPHGPGLMQLYLSGYLARRESLHCPRDVYTQPDSDEYFDSYIRKDEDAAAGIELNRYTYLSTRGVIDDTNSYYFRQLLPAADTGGSMPAPVVDPNWHPDDDTVVTWCSFHSEYIEMGGIGQYNVLFWDGSVRRVGEHIMTDDATGPDAAWKVGRDDATG
jgi:prepilin-type processing-associated H-X9-DG protein